MPITDRTKVSEEYSENKKICRKCLIAAQAEAFDVAAEMDRFLAMLKPEDLAGDGLFSKRISICKDCSYLLGATCNACGCYVEFRANVAHSNCPKKKW